MTLQQRTRKYYSAPPLAQRPRVEPLPSPIFDWREARNWFAPLLLLVAAVSLYLLQSSFATTSELELARLAKERDAILHRNIQLAAEIAELERPSRIRERAYALGLVDTGKSIRLNVSVNAAEPNTTVPNAPAPDRPSLPRAPLGQGAPWQQLLNEFARWMSQAAEAPN